MRTFAGAAARPRRSPPCSEATRAGCPCVLEMREQRSLSVGSALLRARSSALGGRVLLISYTEPMIKAFLIALIGFEHTT